MACRQPGYGGARSRWLATVSNHTATSRTLGVFAVCAIKK